MKTDRDELVKRRAQAQAAFENAIAPNATAATATADADITDLTDLEAAL